MKFGYVKRTLNNNEGESPSLYLALCVIESLIEDMEAEAHAEIDEIPLGEDQVPTQLVRLCNTINRIYSTRDEELVRNRKRLDAAMERLKHTRGDLEGLEKEMQRIAEEEAKVKAAELRIEELRDAARHLQQVEMRHQKLQEEIQILEAELPRPGAEDPIRIAEERLAALQREKEARAWRLEQLARETEAEEKTVAGMEQQDQIYQQAMIRLTGRRNELQQQEMVIREQLQNAGNETLALEGAIGTLKREQEETIRRQVLLEEERNALCHDLEHYHETAVLPLENELAALREELNAKRGENGLLDQELSALKSDKHALIYNITKKQMDRDKLMAEREEKQKEFDSIDGNCRILQGSLNQLQAEKDKRTEELGLLQTGIAELKNTTLPEITAFLENEKALHQELCDSIDRMTAEREGLETELEEKKLAAAQLEQSVAALQSSISVLTARCTENDSQLKKLNEQVQELTGKTDEEKVQKRKEQLEARIVELHRLEMEMESLEQQLTGAEKDLEAACEKLRVLNLRKEETEQAEKQIADTLQLLAPLDTPEYIQRCREAGEQLAFLSAVRSSLFASLSKMRVILGMQETREEKELLEMKEQLAVLKQALDAYQNTLAAYTGACNLNK